MPGLFDFLKRGSAAPEDRYRTLARVGEGGAAIVSRVFDTALCRIVAEKELKSSDEAPEHARQSFTREARLVCYLDHPGVAPIYDSYENPTQHPCYVMKLVTGETLTRRMRERSEDPHAPLPVAEAVGVLTRVAQTLAYAHDRGVIHLDLKPDNVMIGPYGEVLLMDWGNARLFDAAPYRAYLGDQASEEDISLLTYEPPDLLSGTPHYMSPEQTCTPRNLLRPPSDVFSAGTLLYRMLTGRVPFVDKQIGRLLDTIRVATPPPIRERNAQVPPRLAEICGRMMAKAPAERYADFHEVLADLAAYQEAGQGFPTRRLAKGEVLLEEGDEGDGAYVIVAGRVDVSKHTSKGEPDQCLATLGPGEILGELAILTGQPRSATVTAVEDTLVRFMGREEVERELEKLPPWVGTMVSTLGTRFLALNEELVHRRGEA